MNAIPKRKVKIASRWLFVALTLLVMIAIFVLSSQTGEQSGQLSEQTLDVLKSAGMDKTVTPELLSAQAYANVRKWAHVYLYALLGLLLPQAVAVRPMKLRWILIVSVGIAFLYSASDEFHQLFVPGRAGLVSDLGVDAIGYLSGIGISFLILLLWLRHVKKQNREERL